MPTSAGPFIDSPAGPTAYFARYLAEALAYESMPSQVRSWWRSRERVELLLHAWDRSRFYRELWRGIGLDRRDLPRVAHAELPAVSKEQLMDRWDDVVTVPGVTIAQVSDFLVANPEADSRFADRFVVVNTSGSSGRVGVFIYSLAEMLRILANTAVGMTGSLRAAVEQRELRRVAFVGDGHGLGPSLASVSRDVRGSPISFPINVHAARAEIIEHLRREQPTSIGTFPSVLERLLALDEQGAIELRMEQVILSGEPTTAELWERIQRRWGAAICEVYGTTECGLLARRDRLRDPFRVLSNVAYVEALSEPSEQGEATRIVVTPMYRRVFPLIRYRFDDDIIPGARSSSGELLEISSIRGRTISSLRVRGEHGADVLIGHYALNNLFAPGVTRFQFLPQGPERLEVLVTGAPDVVPAARQAVEELLRRHAVSPEVEVQVELVSVCRLLPTGKTPLVWKG